MFNVIQSSRSRKKIRTSLQMFPVSSNMFAWFIIRRQKCALLRTCFRKCPPAITCTASNCCHRWQLAIYIAADKMASCTYYMLMPAPGAVSVYLLVVSHVAKETPCMAACREGYERKDWSALFLLCYLQTHFLVIREGKRLLPRQSCLKCVAELAYYSATRKTCLTANAMAELAPILWFTLKGTYLNSSRMVDLTPNLVRML